MELKVFDQFKFISKTNQAKLTEVPGKIAALVSDKDKNLLLITFSKGDEKAKIVDNIGALTY